MTPEEEWKKISDRVADAMLSHTRPFATPLSTEASGAIHLIGTGSYVERAGKRLRLTCEHVVRDKSVQYRFFGSNSIFGHGGPWIMNSGRADAAVAEIGGWSAASHEAVAIPMHRFPARHRIADRAELLFFLGFAGEKPTTASTFTRRMEAATAHRKSPIAEMMIFSSYSGSLK